MVLRCAESSPFTFIQTIANQENITYGNLIEVISKKFSCVDYSRKSETKLRVVIVRNVGNIVNFSNKLRLTAKDHYGLDSIVGTYRRTLKRR